MKSVGMIVFIKICDKLFAILQKRGEYNFEKGLKDGIKTESYAGALQVTVHGKCENEESPMDTLVRETPEEIGINFYRWFKKDKLASLTTCENAITYGYMYNGDPEPLFSSIRLHSGSGGLILVEKKSIIENLLPENKTPGIRYRQEFRMFPDEIEALKKGFEIF